MKHNKEIKTCKTYIHNTQRTRKQKQTQKQTNEQTQEHAKEQTTKHNEDNK